MFEPVPEYLPLKIYRGKNKIADIIINLIKLRHLILLYNKEKYLQNKLNEMPINIDAKTMTKHFTIFMILFSYENEMR